MLAVPVLVSVRSILKDGAVRQPVDIGNADGREDEHAVDDGLPHHAALGVVGGARRTAEVSGLDEGQKVTYEIVKDKRTGKSAADNLSMAG